VNASRANIVAISTKNEQLKIKLQLPRIDCRPRELLGVNDKGGPMTGPPASN